MLFLFAWYTSYHIFIKYSLKLLIGTILQWKLLYNNNNNNNDRLTAFDPGQPG